MAALRYTARRILSGQAPQSMFRTSFLEDKRCQLPTVIHSGSFAYSRRFYCIQSDQADPITLEEKMKIYKRGAHLFFRASKAVATIVACGIAIKLSVNELFFPGYLWHETRRIIGKYRNVVLKDKPSEMEINSVMLKKEALVEAKLVELRCQLQDAMLRKASPEAAEQQVEVESNE